MNQQAEAQSVIEPPQDGKFRFTRKRRKEMRVVETLVDGAVRYKIAGYYIGGKRVRKFFETPETAQTFIDAQTVREENIGTLARNLDVHASSDAAEAVMMLRPFNVRLLDAVREWTAARKTLSAFPDVPLAEAVKHYAQVLAERTHSWTVEEGAKAWLKSLDQKNRSARYVLDATKRLSRLRESFGSVSMADMTRDHIERWVRSLGKQGPQSVKNYITVASSMFAYAVKRGKSPRNPVTDVDKPEVVREEAGILTPAELRRLLNHLPDDTVPFVALSAFAGLRPAEVQRIEWTDINFKSNTIAVRASMSKTKRRRVVPLTSNLAAWLRPLAKESGKVVELADLTLRQKRIKPARIKAKLTRWPHDCLRHSCASYWLETEKDAARVALWLGHNQDVMHEHYKGLLTNPADAPEWFAIMPAPERVERQKIVNIKAA